MIINNILPLLFSLVIYTESSVVIDIYFIFINEYRWKVHWGKNEFNGTYDYEVDAASISALTMQYSEIGQYNVTVYCENGLGNDQIVIVTTILGPIVKTVFADPADPITVVKTNDDQHVAVQVEGKIHVFFYEKY